MKLKYKVVLTLFVSSLVLGFGGYAIGSVYATIAGIILFVLSISTLSFSDKNDQSVISILADGIFFNMI